MARNDDSEASIPSAVGRAIRLIRQHPSVESVEPLSPTKQSGIVAVHVKLRLELPLPWRASGKSPNGVRAVESVRLVFPQSYPLMPPEIFLRDDFDRSLAHVQPGPPDHPPVPCIYNGNLGELVQRLGQQGLAEIINRLVDWLEKAALDRLIDPTQGWEPVRRDSLPDILVMDADKLHSLVSRSDDYIFLELVYTKFEHKEKSYYEGQILNNKIAISPKTPQNRFSRWLKSSTTETGKSLALFAWPGAMPSGELFVSDRYHPETVEDYNSLKSRSEEYGCERPLSTAIRWLRKCLAGYAQLSPTFPLAIILCARRPFHLIGSNSNLELCPYILEITPPGLLENENQTPVRSAGHRHAISTELLRRMSDGQTEADSTPPWVQLGCGSLGSKIAIHLARAGRAPSAVVDNRPLSPHNVARHALVPSHSKFQPSWLYPKAFALSSAIQALGQEAEPYFENAIEITRNKKRARHVLPKNAWGIVNTTASLTVREALASTPPNITIPRIIDTSLLGQGKVGIVTIEGPQRNPNAGDLISYTYKMLLDNPVVRTAVYGQEEEEEEEEEADIGQGCGSVTTIMPDAQVSMFAAPIAEQIRKMQTEGLPKAGGRIMIGHIQEDGISLAWESTDVEPCEIAETEGSPKWHARVLPLAHRKIIDEIARWPGVETGGILLGRLSESARAFYVVDVLPAPEDSERSKSRFVLGTNGIRSKLLAYSKSVNNSLYCLGTWHNHLTSSGSSQTDRATAEALALACLLPSVLLIHTPGGYRAVLADQP